MLGVLLVILVMVLMFVEVDIVDWLIGWLFWLDYLCELMDVLIVVEEIDCIICEVLEGVMLLCWMCVVKVFDGLVCIKLCVLNYVLNFCCGLIIGVWDVEDWFEFDQLYKVVCGFYFVVFDVVCLQGVLDYYNLCINWLVWMFIIEYVVWFCGILVGVVVLDLVVLLGGMMLFFCCDLFEKVGVWDVWNVIEDVDLGVCLIWCGYCMEMLDIVMYEEVNCCMILWVKQWLCWFKGFMMIWVVYMCDLVVLWCDLGVWCFIGLQVQFVVLVL